MGFRFHRSIRLFKGVRLNFSKTGTSLSVGRPGATINIKDGKTTYTAGLPGTGISYRTTEKTSGGGGVPPVLGALLFWLFVAWVIVQIDHALA